MKRITQGYIIAVFIALAALGALSYVASAQNLILSDDDDESDTGQWTMYSVQSGAIWMYHTGTGETYRVYTSCNLAGAPQGCKTLVQ